MTGVAQQGQTLTASPGTWTGNPVPTYTYQWQRCDTAGANCVNIASATAQTYQPVAADVGATVRVNVTATNSAGTSTAPSAATATVTGATASRTAGPCPRHFNRANGAIGPNWGQIFGGFVDFAVSGSEALDPSASSFAWDFWAALQFGPDSEAYATITTLSTDAIRMCARMTNPTTSQRSGYCVQATGNTWSIRRIDNGTATQLGAVATQTVAAGSRFGITVVGTTITAWYAPSCNRRLDSGPHRYRQHISGRRLHRDRSACVHTRRLWGRHALGGTRRPGRFAARLCLRPEASLDRAIGPRLDGSDALGDTHPLRVAARSEGEGT